MTARAAHGVSPQTLLPRFVIRIRKGDRYYYYLRIKGRREPLPKITDPSFAAVYSSKLVANGLLAEAAKPFPVQMVPQKVYFIEDVTTGAIKVGVAKWPLNRLADMQVGTSAPLRLIAVAPGGRGLEKALHTQFSEHRLRGEWFSPHPDILAEIERLNA